MSPLFRLSAVRCPVLGANKNFDHFIDLNKPGKIRLASFCERYILISFVHGTKKLANHTGVQLGIFLKHWCSSCWPIYLNIICWFLLVVLKHFGRSLMFSLGKESSLCSGLNLEQKLLIYLIYPLFFTTNDRLVV